MADRNLRAAVLHFARRNAHANLLCDRVGWNRRRDASDGGALMRFGIAYAHAEPDGILKSDPEATIA